jgi:hypothetical protein
MFVYHLPVVITGSSINLSKLFNDEVEGMEGEGLDDRIKRDFQTMLEHGNKQHDK